jgi:hypothetical protein
VVKIAVNHYPNIDPRVVHANGRGVPARVRREQRQVVRGHRSVPRTSEQTRSR